MKHVAFPDYLGYGKLDPKTIYEQEGFRSADYNLLGQNVMTVKCWENITEIQEYWEGCPLSMTRHRDLQQAVSRHFLITGHSKNPIYSYLMDKIIRMGNIYAQYDEDSNQSWKAIYYPAVYLYMIRIPIPDSHAETVIKALDNPWFYEREFDTYQSRIHVNWKHREQEDIDLTILEIIVPVAFLYECVEKLVEMKIIHPQKLYRAILQNAFHKSTTKGNSFYGRNKDDWREYTIYYSLH